MKYLTKIHDFEIVELNNRPRKIRVFYPETMNENNHYNVLYMLDGQNLVDPAPYSGYSWDVVNTVTRLIEKDEVEPLIIVGIDNDALCRVEEYSESLSDIINQRLNKNNQSTKVPEAIPFSKFVVDSVIPFINQNYFTKTDRTGISGSSCGGNISYYLGAIYPDIFKVIGAFSPATWVVKESIFNTIYHWSLHNSPFIYHDMGLKETKFFSLKYVIPLYRIHRILRKNHPNKKQIKLVIDPRATHTELFWQLRFEGFLKQAYKK